MTISMSEEMLKVNENDKIQKNWFTFVNSIKTRPTLNADKPLATLDR